MTVQRDRWQQQAEAVIRQQQERAEQPAWPRLWRGVRRGMQRRCDAMTHTDRFATASVKDTDWLGRIHPRPSKRATRQIRWRLKTSSKERALGCSRSSG